jgi:hypothetical protein
MCVVSIDRKPKGLGFLRAVDNSGVPGKVSFVDQAVVMTAIASCELDVGWQVHLHK